ncbi:MAG: aminopeptidase P family protein [Oscillospiraceae bacterium]|jgi:Xaa-Pro aminopeptidase|nr:aminopeptidase P family protein [Oscillospiraceae bacterium]
MSNIKRIQNNLPLRCAALIECPRNRRYLTGFVSSYGSLLLTRDTAVLLTDSRYIEAAQAAVACCAVEEIKAGRLRNLCKSHGVKKLWLEGSATMERVQQLRTALPGVYLSSNRALDVHMNQLRMIKHDDEAQKITAAQRIAEAAFAQVLPTITVGMTERDVALALDFAMLRGGAERLSFDTIVAAGVNGSKPHAVPGDYALRRGDLITMDFGAVVEGYHSDMTRTVALGEPSAQAREIYDVVLAAQEAALAVIAPGVACKDVDAAARDMIKAAGYGEHFRHGTGHGVGLAVHEEPRLSEKSREVLRPGMVVTVEPGVYLPGVCGVRIEDLVVVTDTGYVNLTACEKELMVV